MQPGPGRGPVGPGYRPGQGRVGGLWQADAGGLLGWPGAGGRGPCAHQGLARVHVGGRSARTCGALEGSRAFVDAGRAYVDGSGWAGTKRIPNARESHACDWEKQRAFFPCVLLQVAQAAVRPWSPASIGRGQARLASSSRSRWETESRGGGEGRGLLTPTGAPPGAPWACPIRRTGLFLANSGSTTLPRPEIVAPGPF
jgi:hypothetical protein